MPAPLSIPFTLSFVEALAAALRRRVVLPNAYYDRIPVAARSLAWTVSGIGRLEQIRSVLDSLNEAQRDGIAFGEWQRTALAQSWKLPSHRLELIFRNHAQTAYSAGHWRQFEQLQSDRPFLMYSAIDDARTRPTHAAMSGWIAPLSDPIWRKWTPPCGHNCRCSQISLTRAQAEARGYLTQKSAPDVEPDPGFGNHPIQAEESATEYFTKQAIETNVPKLLAAARAFIAKRLAPAHIR